MFVIKGKEYHFDMSRPTDARNYAKVLRAISVAETEFDEQSTSILKHVEAVQNISPSKDIEDMQKTTTSAADTLDVFADAMESRMKTYADALDTILGENAANEILGETATFQEIMQVWADIQSQINQRTKELEDSILEVPTGTAGKPVVATEK